MLERLSRALLWAIFSFGIVSLFSPQISQAFELRVIDWVQGRPGIPHPAVNGKPTMLQAIVEAPECSGSVKYRWDINADGDFNDGDEHWRDASTNYGSTYYFNYATIDVQLPNARGDTTMYPKIEAKCNGWPEERVQSKVFPVMIRVDRMCSDYAPRGQATNLKAKRTAGCGADDNLLLTQQWENDRSVDRSMWWMFRHFYHRANDPHSCTYEDYYGHGHALNVFIRRSHGAGPYRDQDVYFEHVVECGVVANLEGWGSESSRAYWRSWSNDLGYDMRWQAYGSTSLIEPIAGFGDPDYLIKSGTFANKTIRQAAPYLMNGLLHAQGNGGGWFYGSNNCYSGMQNGPWCNAWSSTSDLSTTGWAPEALRMLERKLGVASAQERKNRMRNWLDSHASYDSNNGTCLGGRGFGTSYHMNGSWHPGYRTKLAGNAMVCYGWSETQQFYPDIFNGNDAHNHHPGWKLREHWVGLSKLYMTSEANVYNGTGPWNLYSMYAATKGLRSYVPEVKYLANYDHYCNEGDHDECDLTINGEFAEGRNNCTEDAHCKSGHLCRSGSCKVVLEEGRCIAGHYKMNNGGSCSTGWKPLGSGTGRTNHWVCARDWAAEFARTLITMQRSDGSWNYFSCSNEWWANTPDYDGNGSCSGSSSRGDWYGYGRKSHLSVTAMSAQVVQTWLETWATARAIPQQTTPGIPVIFNHTWSHVLDPTTHIKMYMWDVNTEDADGGLWWELSNCNVPINSFQQCMNAHNQMPDLLTIDFPEFDPDTVDENGVPVGRNYGEVRYNNKIVGFVTQEVGNKDNYQSLSNNERVSMDYQEFEYTYTNDISWDDVAKIGVTLRIIDAADRPVTDDKSVTVKLSFDNHKPVIVAHPLGLNEIYSGYVGLPMYLDAKTASYDVDQCVRDQFGNPTFGNCGKREVFPGNEEKPAGFPDKITKICFDLDRDGTFCEAGETQVDLNANPPVDLPGVTFTPQAGVVKVGELTGIPVMVCDDGRWNGRCWEQGDGAPNEFTAGVGPGMPSTCTLCAYGSASVKAVENEVAPQVPDWQPDPREAEVTIVLDDNPSDENYFTLSDHNGSETRFVFDSDSDKADGTRKIPEGQIKVEGIPGDGETFVLSDYNPGQGTYFVFLDDTTKADGSEGPKTIIGIDHVRVGIKNASTPQVVASRIAQAINSKSTATPGYNPNNPGAVALPLYVKAEAQGKNINLTMLNDGAARGADPLRPDHTANFPEKGGTDPSPTYYQYVNMDLVSNVDGTDFAGGVIVGMQNTNGNVEKVVENLESAVKASNLSFGKVEAVGRALVLKQNSVGFSGNTAVDMSGVDNARTQERGEEICGLFGQVCCDGVTAPKCGDGTGCLQGRCVSYGGTYAQDSTDACVIPNAIMNGDPNEGDGCTCPEGLTATSLGEFDQAPPANAGGAASQFIKLFTCSPGRGITYEASAQGELPATTLPMSDFQGGFGKTYHSQQNGFTCLQGEGLIKTIKPLPAAQCPETGFDLDQDGNIDRMQSMTIRGVRHAGPEEQCAVKFDLCIDTLQASKPDNYTFGGFFTRGGLGGGTSNPLTNAQSCPGGFTERQIPMLLRHPNGGDNTMNAAQGNFVMCERMPPQRYVELAGNYERPERAGGKATFFAGHDGAYVDNELGALNGGAPMAVWRVQPGNVLELDFSTIVDPEGVLGSEIQSNGVRMIYELMAPDNLQLPAGVNPALQPHVLRPSVGFENRVSGAVPNHNTDNFGMKPLLEPAGDGVQYFKIRVTAYDAGNKSNSRDFTVKLDNRPPRLTKFLIQPFPLPPTFPYEEEESTGYLKTIRDYCQRQNPPIPNCVEPYADLPDPVIRKPPGTFRHRYDINLKAFPNAGVGLIVAYEAVEDYDEPLTAKATFISNGQSTDGGTIVGTTGTFKSTYDDLPPYQENADGTLHPNAIQTVRVQLTVTDGEDTLTEFKDIDVAQPPPILLEELFYNFDLLSDGRWEVTDQEDPVYWSFFMRVGSESVPFTVSILNNDMVSSFDFDAKLPNTAPEVSAGLLNRDGREVTVSVSAGDLDWDPMTYSIDWGDGTPVSRGTGNVYAHTYPVGLYGDYVITASANDGRPNGTASKQLTVKIEPPGSKEADITGLKWAQISIEAGRFDGVGTFGVDPAGTVYAHDFLSEIRRYKTAEIAAADNNTFQGTLVMGDVECCSSIVAPSAGEVYVTAPNGFYYVPGANGDNPGAGVTQLSASGYEDVDVTPNWDREANGEESFILAVSKAGALERWTRTHDLVVEDVPANLQNYHIREVQTCKGSSNLTAIFGMNYNNGSNAIFLNSTAEATPDSWVVGPAKMAKGLFTSLSFDRDCILYIGGEGGYFTYDASTGLVDPPETTPQEQYLHVYGWDLYNPYVGTGRINRVIAWPGGKPALAGSPIGMFGANEPWNATTKPYWTPLREGMTASRHVTEMALDPVSGNIFVSTSESRASPKYCRRRIRGRRRAFRYYFCGFTYNYNGGLFKTENSILSSKTTGAGGVPFALTQGNGVSLDPLTGGLKVDPQVSGSAPLWQVNTLESTVSRWDPVAVPPQEIGRYRVGIPSGECAGNDSPFTAGCNNPSRLAVDNVGDVYVASAGYDIQGTVTKIATDITRCVDRNGNGRIDTSIDSTPKDYTMAGVQGAIGDECILWTAAVGQPGKLLRSIVVGAGDANHPDGYPWVGSYSDRKLYRLNPKTGVVINSHDLDIEPFGASLVGDMMMVSTLGSAVIQPVNTRGAGEVRATTQPDNALLGGCTVDNAYGIGADALGQVWLSGWDCPYALGYNPAGDYWCKVTLPFRQKVGRGISGDLEGRVWASLGGDGQSYLVNWQANVCQANSDYVPGRANVVPGPWGANGPTGVNVDANNKVWLSHYLSPVMMSVDQFNNNRTVAWQTNNVYSFSDGTGTVRRLSIGSGSFVQDYQSPCDNGTRWGLLSWDGSVPAMGDMRFSIRTASTAAKLNEATPIPFVEGAQPPQVVQDYVANNVNPETFHNFLRVRVDMMMGANRQSPVLNSFTVNWECL